MEVFDFPIKTSKEESEKENLSTQSSDEPKNLISFDQIPLQISPSSFSNNGNAQIIKEENELIQNSSEVTELKKRRGSNPNDPTKFKEMRRESISLVESPIGNLRHISVLTENSLSSENSLTKTVNDEEIKECEKEAESILKQKGSWIFKVSKYLKYAIISDQTEGTFKDIYVLIKTLLKGMTLNPLDLTTSLLVISTYHSGTVVRTDLVVKDINLLKSLVHWCYFANAVYGWKLVYAYQGKTTTYMKDLYKGFIDTNETNLRILLQHTGIKKEDIIATKWTSDTFQPAHFIAFDHSTQSIVWSIRGTMAVRDTIIDLNAKYSPFKCGFTHGGILASAEKKYKKCVPLILKSFERYPNYKLIICGHSLGAGMATLLALMWNDEYSIPMHCYAFAPPCILSLDLALKCRPFVTTVIVNDDIIPRLSFSSIEDFKRIVQYVLDENKGNMQRIFQVFSAGNVLGDLTNKLAEKFNWKTVPDLGIHKMEITDRLYPPGNIYHVFSKGGKFYNTVEQSAPSLFKDIVISSSMLMDHLPDVYEDALICALQTLEHPDWDEKKKLQERKQLRTNYH